MFSAISVKSPWPVVAALSAGAANVFAFAPFGYWPLQFACTTLLFYLVVRASTVRRAAVLGWLYSFAGTSAGVHWLYVSLHDLGGMPAWLTVLAIALLALGLGLLVGAATGGGRWLQQRWRTSTASMLLMVLPALWTLAEWTRSWIFTGFPWLSTGYAHGAAPLAGYASLLGVYGVGWVAAMVAGLLALACLKIIGHQVILPHLRKSLTLHVAGIVAACVVIILVGQGLRGLAWTNPYGKPISVRLIQGNVPQAMKFDPAELGATLGLYDALITQAPAELIVTPETALPITPQQLPTNYLPRLALFAQQSQSNILLGIPLSDRPENYTNGLIVLDPTTVVHENVADTSATSPILPKTIYRYDKHHLVPFGEFIPLGFRWFVDTMNIPLGDQRRGPTLQAPFAVKQQWVLPNICYEDLFGEEIASQMRWRAQDGQPMPTILLNISNIAWFGNTIALPQHLQISQMRTLETGRPMLRATNTGATAIIDAHGNVLSQLPAYTRSTLAATVQGYQGSTPFIRYGNGLIVAICLLALGAAFVHSQLLKRLESGMR